MSLPRGRSSPRPGSIGRPIVRIRGTGRPSLLGLAAIAALALGLGGAAVAGRPASRDQPPHGGGGAESAARSPVAPSRAARVPDAPWIASLGDGTWVFARGDRPPIRRLPPDEIGLAIDPSFVATIVPTADGHTTVRLRDTASGRRLLDVRAPIWVAAGAFTPSGLVVTGYADGTMAADAGLLLIETASGAIATLSEARPFASTLGTPVARGDVLVSASGRTVASNACGPERCDLQVVDLATGRVSHPITGGLGFLRAVSDEAVVTSDDAGRWVRGRAIADGRELWRLDGSALIEPAILVDGSVVGLVGSPVAGWAVATIDPSGRVHDLTARARGGADPARLWRPLTTPGAVVYGKTSFEEALGTHHATTVTVFVPGTRRSSDAAVQLAGDLELVP